MLERDAAERAAMYEAIPARAPAGLAVRDHRAADRNVAERGNLQGMVWGPSFDDNKYWQGSKE